MGGGSERLWEVIEAYAAAVRPVRELDTEYREDDPEGVFSAKLELGALDTGLVLPAFIARMILTHDPHAAEAPAVGAAFDEVEKIDAIRRAAEVVATVHALGFAAAHGMARKLAEELREWAEATLPLPDLRPALLAYRADPLPINQQRLAR
jgi:hypothetical protein